jgi:hypothetical protein
MHKAFLALDRLGQTALAKDLMTAIATFNVATDGSMNVPSAYSEIVIILRLLEEPAKKGWRFAAAGIRMAA